MIIQYVSANPSPSMSIAFCIRLVLAVACGALIGLERKKNYKVAGLRTHMLVCCGAALLMILSKYAWGDLVGADGKMLFGNGGADPSRIASQVVCGIGFLGAGVIFKTGVSIKGLTTAAGLWMTAGVGLAIGSGFLILGIFSAAFITIMQFAMHKRSVGIDSYAMTTIRLIVRDTGVAGNIISDLTERSKAVVSDTRIVKEDNDTLEYTLTLKVPGDLTYDKIERFMKEHDEVVGINIIY